MFNIDFSLPIIDYKNFSISQFGDAFLFGGSVLLIGMVTIFIVLCLLWLFLVVFKLVFQNISEKSARKKATTTTTVVETSNEAKNDNEEEIVAVIAAAIAMAESENSDLKFRVVSFKKV